MSQFGMQMPGGRAKSTPTLNVYTGLLFLAVAALATATAIVWIQGGKIGPDGNALELQQEGQPIKLAESSP